MELDQSTPVTHPFALEWYPRTAWHTHRSKAFSPHLSLAPRVYQVVRRNHSRQGGWIQVLASLSPSSQTVGSNIRVIHKQVNCSSWMKEHLAAKLGKGIMELTGGRGLPSSKAGWGEIELAGCHTSSKAGWGEMELAGRLPSSKAGWGEMELAGWLPSSNAGWRERELTCSLPAKLPLCRAGNGLLTAATRPALHELANGSLQVFSKEFGLHRFKMHLATFDRKNWQAL